MVEKDAVPKLKVAELKEELTKVGLDTTGKKDELAQRLLTYLESLEESVKEPEKVEEPPKVVTIQRSLTLEEKKKLRAERFGIPEKPPVVQKGSVQKGSVQKKPVTSQAATIRAAIDPAVLAKREAKFGKVEIQKPRNEKVAH